MRAPTFSLRDRLLLLVCISLLPALGLALYSNAEQRSIAEENVRREAIGAVQLVSAHQERLIESARQFLLFLTHLPSVRSEDKTGCTAILQPLLKRYPLYTNIGVARRDGAILCSSVPYEKTVNVGSGDWFIKAVADKDFVAGGYQAGRVTGETSITFASPVEQGGTVTGVGFVSMNLKWLGDLAAKADLPPSTELQLVDSRGIILARYPDPERRVGKAVHDPNLLRMLLDGGQTTVSGVGIDGVERLYAVATIAEQPGGGGKSSVVIGIPTGIAFAEVNRLLVVHLSGLAGLAVLTLALAAFWGKVLVLRAEEANLRLAAIVESTEDAVIGASLDGRIESWNPAAERLYGHGASAMRGGTLERLWPEDRRKETEELLARLRAGEPLSVETEHITKDNRRIYVSLSLSPVRSQGRHAGLSVIARDITERKMLDLAQSEFVSLASHQLRAPLTAIRWSMEMLLGDTFGAVSDEQKKVMGETMRYAIDLGETIDLMLMISRIEAGKHHVERVDVDMGAFVTDLLEVHRPSALEKKIALESVLPKTPLTLRTDAASLKEVVSNLVSNAVRYTPEGGKVTVTVTAGKTSARIDVTDTGYGIPAHEQEKIFSKFFRAQNAMKKVPNGTGLGLYLAHSLAELLGGTLSFVSAVNKGTTFSIELPLTPPGNA